MHNKKEDFEKFKDEDLSYAFKNEDNEFKMSEDVYQNIEQKIQNEILKYESQKTQNQFNFSLFKSLSFSGAFAALLIIILISIYFFYPSISSNLMRNQCIALDIVGSPKVLNKNGKIKGVLTKDTNVLPGESLITDENSQVKLTIGNNYSLFVEKNTHVHFTTMNKKKEIEKTIVQLDAGRIVFEITELSPNSIFQVNASLIKANVVGTIFSVEVDPEKEIKISVVRGKVKIKAIIDHEVWNDLENKMSSKIAEIEQKINPDFEINENEEVSVNYQAVQSTLSEINIWLDENKDQLANLRGTKEEQGKIIEKVIDEIDKKQLRPLINEKSFNSHNNEDNNEKNNAADNSNENIEEKNKLVFSSYNLKLNKKISNLNSTFIADGKNLIIVNHKEKELYYYDTLLHKIKWIFTHPDLVNFTSAPVVFKNKIILVTPIQFWILTKEGKLESKQDLENGINYWAKIIKDQNRILIPTFQTIYSYNNIQLDNLKDFTSAQGQIYCSLFENKLFYTDSNAQKISIYDLQTSGILPFEYQLAYKSFIEPTITQMGVFTADLSGTIYHLNKDNLTEIAKTKISTGINQNIIYADKKLFFIANDGGFYWVNAAQLNQVNKIVQIDQAPNTEKYLNKELIHYKDKLFYANDLGQLFTYNIKAGNYEFISIMKSPAGLIGNPVLTDQFLYLLDENANIYQAQLY